MRKEIFIAIFLGLSLGSIVTYGIYTANKAIQDKAIDKPQTTTIPTPTPIPPQLLQVSIETPENYKVFTSPDIKIAGIAQQDTIISIITENNEIFTQTDKEGNFSQEVELIKGANTILVNASDGTTISPTKTLNLVYSTQLDKEK